ncbi:MAG: PH domain-containing protein [Clostridiaceae bacterium]
MEYVPEKNNIRIFITAGLMFIDLVVIALFLIAHSVSIKGLLVFLFLLLNLYGGYFLILLGSLKFHLSAEEFAISGAFDMKRTRIPISEITCWSRRITLLENVGASLHTARFALGKGLDSNGDSADLFITSSKKAIFLKTKRGNYGISPELADEFIEQLKELGIPQMLGNERSYMKSDDNQGRSPLNQLMLYGILLTVILLLLPVLMYLMNLLPAWIPQGMNRYITQNAYLETVITKGLLVLLLILMSYGIVVLLSTSQGKFYYRIMYVPLAMVVTLLFLEINTHLNILLNF